MGVLDSRAARVAVVLAAVAILVVGVVWATARDRIEPPEPAAVTLPQGEGRSSAANGDGAPLVFSVLGDSYSAGDGAGWVQGWVMRLSKEMCWKLGKASTQSGAGYVAARIAGSTPFTARVDGMLVSSPSIVFVEGGLNDVQVPSEEISKAAGFTFTTLKDRMAGGVVVAVGPVVTPAANRAEVDRVSAAIASAAAGAGIVYVDPAKDGWLTDAVLFNDDGFHPTSDGYAEYTRRLIEVLSHNGIRSGCNA